MGLNPSYWKYFSDENGVRDGEKFEDLVASLLELEFQIEWSRSKKTHDGNKDFFIENDEGKIWVECKNYKKSLAMSTISPTLVMAQIHDVDKIYFFSASPFNNNGRKKILDFGTKVNKQICFYDGLSLENLIIKHSDNLIGSFKPARDNINEIGYPSQCNFYFLSNPTNGNSFEDLGAIPLEKVVKLNFETTFEICIYLTNPNIDKSTEAKVTILEEENMPPVFFLINREELGMQNSNYFNFNIPVVSGKILHLFFKQGVYSDHVMLPKIQVELKVSEVINQYESPSKRVRSSWSGFTKLIGSNYVKILNNLNEKILDNTKFSILTITGSSGTGKTRLLDESQDYLLKKKYRIIRFNGEKEHSSTAILQELVCFLFEVPRESLIELLSNQTSHLGNGNSKLDNTYKLIRKFNENVDQDELFKTIDEYGPVLFEKIAKHKFALILDNIQFLGDEIKHFLLKYLEYSQNQYYANYSVLICTFNTDHLDIFSNQLLNLISSQSKENRGILVENICGFEQIDQGILYLREMAHITSNQYDQLFERLVNKVSNRPFYLYSAFNYLVANRAILPIPDSKGYLLSLAVLELTISKMPVTINEILSNLWKNILENRKEDIRNIYDIVSTVILFGQLNSRLIYTLSLDKDLIDLLIQKSILKIDISKSENPLIFEHSLIEKHLMSVNPKVPYQCIDLIAELRCLESIRDYELPYLLSFMSQNKRVKNIVSFCRQLLVQNIPPSLSEIYFDSWFKFVEKNQEKFNEVELCQVFYNIATYAKERLPIQKVKTIYAKGNDVLGTYTDALYLEPIYRKFINSYSDTLFHHQEIFSSVELLTNSLNETIALSKENKCLTDDERDQYNATLGLYFNRLYINMRTKKDKESQKETKKYLSLSKHHTQKIIEPALRDELIFMNLSDEGYVYYFFHETKTEVLDIWGKCLQFSNEEIPNKTMNLYRKKIQISLIEQNYDKTLKLISEAKEYLENGKYSHERYVFRNFLAIAEMMSLIQKNPLKEKARLRELLDDAIQVEQFSKTGRKLDILILRGIYSYYQNDSINVYDSFKQAYNDLYNQIESTNKDIKLRLLLQNILVSFSQLNITSSFFDLSFLKDSSILKKLNEKKWTSGQIDKISTGIIRTTDNLFNLPRA